MLNIFKHIEPVKKKKIGLSPEWNEAICKEVEELTNANILREVKYQTWVSNPVMMAEGDEEKTAFFTREGVFCYKKLPFGLKNAGAMYVDDMVKEISDLQPPKMIKEIQSLNEKLAALSRFLSKGADKALSFMKILKNCMNKKVVQWTGEAGEAFQKIKECLKTLPTLTAPIKGKALVMYLAASWESISAVLLAKKGKRQVPIYFVSQTLQGAELNYPELEKLILALQILAMAEKSRRIAKWAVELEDHDIEFRGHNPVKGQILADFLVETPSTKSKEKEAKETTDEEAEPEIMWKLYTDEASSTGSFGVGLMLVSPEGKEYTYALRFKFDTTNNEAEYEVLLAGLRIAAGMKVQDLKIFIDSQLVANQVKGLSKHESQ
ncbi:reverse transcriptase domain-containing protein [Tanacetum coccineum]